MKNSQDMPVGSVLLRVENAQSRGLWRLFRSPVTIICAWRLDEVLPCVEEVQRAVEGGRYAAGFLAYEAAPAFDEALTTHPPGELPLLWFGVFDRVEAIEVLPEVAEVEQQARSWKPELDDEAYRLAVDRIRLYIAGGHTYQVNLTQRLRSRCAVDPYALFLALYRTQPVPYAGYLNLGRQAICSLSPELFFRLEGRRIISRPMKGTARRGRWWEEDQQQARQLAASDKDRAENAMIVDMIRNDLGRVAEKGSVKVEEVFRVERYRTLFQMTSTVAAETGASFSEILRALFPCASVTGAPKVRTMQIIRELEASPRGVYTGCIGYLSPSRRALFNVAIRTVVVDTANDRIEYGTGSGITWDSLANSESEECRLKAAILDSRRPAFSLLETILWDGRRYRLIEGHLRRIERSAEYFGYPLDRRAVGEKLADMAKAFSSQTKRVRLLVNEDGEVTCESQPFERCHPRPVWRVALAGHPIDTANPFLYHKTTHRTVYDEARAASPGFDDVLLWNEGGEITESTVANVVLRLAGQLVTPPVSAGLLPGVFREDLLRRGIIREQTIPLTALEAAEAIFLVNSVRGWIGVKLSALPATQESRLG